MHWEDKGIILHSEYFSEKAKILTILTSTHGLYKGLVRISKSNFNIYQAGNSVFVKWQARLLEHLGLFYCELEKTILPSILYNYIKLLAVNCITITLSVVLPPRDININFYPILINLLTKIEESNHWYSQYLFTELVLLKKLGFGLDIQQCGAGGDNNDLKYISPKTGRAVSASKGELYRAKLFHLPNILRKVEYESEILKITSQEFSDSLQIINYFLEKHCFHPYNLPLPSIRKLLLETILNPQNNQVCLL